MSSKANGMSTLEIDVGDIRPVSVAFTADELMATLEHDVLELDRFVP